MAKKVSVLTVLVLALIASILGTAWWLDRPEADSDATDVYDARRNRSHEVRFSARSLSSLPQWKEETGTVPRPRQKVLAWTAIAIAGLVVLLLSTFWHDLVVECNAWRATIELKLS